MKQEDKEYISEYLKKHNISSNELTWMCYMGKLADLTESQLDLYILGEMDIMQREYIRIALMLGIGADEAASVKNGSDIKMLIFKNQESLKEQSKEQEIFSALSKIIKIQEQILDKSEENVNTSYKLVKNILKIPDFEMIAKLADRKAQEIITHISKPSSKEVCAEEERDNIFLKLTDKFKRKNDKKQPTDIFDILSGNNFSKLQAAELIDGLKSGLSASEVMSYAKEEYSPEKMSELKDLLLLMKEQKEDDKTYNDNNVKEPAIENDINDKVDSKQQAGLNTESEEEYVFSGDIAQEHEDEIYDEEFEEYEEYMEEE